MKTNQGVGRGGWRVLLLLAGLGVSGPVSQAHVNSGANCASCHSTARSGMALTGQTGTTNAGSGVLKVFRVKPGETAAIGVNVTDGHNDYGLALVNLGAGGLGNVANKLVYSADTSWAKRSSYYSVGPSTSNRAWTFRLGVQAGTPPDVYLLQMRMAGTGGGRWSQEERFYVQVVAPLPPAPALADPGWRDGAFSCRVPTVSGFTYRLEARRGAAEAWVEVSQVAGDGSVKTLTDPAASGPGAWYRVRVE